MAEKAKELKINTDGMDSKLVKLAIIKKLSPTLNTDSWDDGQIAVGLEMVMVQKTPIVQRPRLPSEKPNTDSEGDEDGHGDYMSRILNSGQVKQGGKDAN